MRALAVKLVRMLVAGAATGIAGIVVIYFCWRFLCPYAEEWRTRVEVAQLERQVQDLRQEHQRLQQQAKLLSTPEGVKVEARRLGLLKPGERSLRFMTRPEPRQTPAETEPPPAGAIARIRTWGRALFGRPDQPVPTDADAAPKPED
ncbi:MAG: septum formation initiator family protein [Armatimonadota bacterium]|nr:MAG: septum formation initiator family protein [Armatimonadota bacterium]